MPAYLSLEVRVEQAIARGWGVEKICRELGTSVAFVEGVRRGMDDLALNHVDRDDVTARAAGRR